MKLQTRHQTIVQFSNYQKLNFFASTIFSCFSQNVFTRLDEIGSNGIKRKSNQR